MEAADRRTEVSWPKRTPCVHTFLSLLCPRPLLLTVFLSTGRFPDSSPYDPVLTLRSGGSIQKRADPKGWSPDGSDDTPTFETAEMTLYLPLLIPPRSSSPALACLVILWPVPSRWGRPSRPRPRPRPSVCVCVCVCVCESRNRGRTRWTPCLLLRVAVQFCVEERVIPNVSCGGPMADK